MKALILAAGRGSNLHPLTDTRPKPMIYMCGKPVLQYIIEGLREIGVHDIILVVGHKKEKIINYFRRGEDFKVSISYIEQESQNGIGNAVMLAEDRFAIGEHFFLVYADIIFQPNIFLAAQMSFNALKAPIATITLAPSSDLYGNVYLDRDVQITRIVEKPYREAGRSYMSGGNYVLAGVFILSAEFFSLLKTVDGDIKRGFDLLIDQNNLFASIFEGEWIDLGYPWNIIDANKLLMKSFTHAHIANSVNFDGSVTIRGPVYIEDGVLIKSGAVINGPCYIGKGSFIGNNVLVREYTSIGSRCTIGFGVELKNCVLFENCKVGRLSFIGDSVLGEGVEIASGVMTVNNLMTDETVKVKTYPGTQQNVPLTDSHLRKLGSFIGDYAKVGASNTLLPGTVISSGTYIPHQGTQLE
jgi:bifunctional UDP-N-acetylglucosamine pyrophosphorylase/glucosamine-1-phosphate N-acetyltransferase